LVDEAIGRLGLVGRRVVVACSGGPDSRTLLEILAERRSARRLELSVVTVDHGLREAAAREAAEVGARARALGLMHVRLPIDLGGRRSMAVARQVRYAALVAEAQRVGASAIAVGHTASDQAETLLDRLVRGAGTRGLAGMPEVRPAANGIVVCRPLLRATRDQVEAYVRENGLPVARDPTNRDLGYRRSRFRHEVLPLLRRERADLDRALSELCDRLRADADALEAAATEAHVRLRVGEDGLSASGLLALPPAIATRVIARACPVPLSATHIAAVLRLCASEEGTRSVDLPSMVSAERRYGQLWFGQLRPDPGDVEVVVPGPGSFALLDVEVTVQPAAFEAFTRGDEGWELWLRNLRPGDRTPSGRLQDLLVNRKVPRRERRWLPLLVRTTPPSCDHSSEVVWVGRMDGYDEGYVSGRPGPGGEITLRARGSLTQSGRVQ
jgi:tRNA(Ile)-lysidine synthetase-like protein